MHYAIIGAGNIGSLYGANLARTGNDVTLIDINQEHIDAIARDGLHMTGLHGEFTADVAATTDPSTVSNVDVAIVCVNGYATEAAANTAKSVLKPDGYALSLQNGLGNLEVLEATLGNGRALGGITFHSADLQAPGRVEHTNHGPTYIGELDKQRTQRVEQLASDLERAEMDPHIEPDIMRTIWGKFVHNCGLNAICAITDLRPGYIRDVPELDEFQTQIIEETLALVTAKGIQLEDPDPITLIKDYSASKFHRVSMTQHLDRGMRTEIDSLNGYVARESLHHGLTAPANDALTKLMKGREYLPKSKPPA